ncbi:MAG TPA: FtsX-like permease family protein, partial [Microbacterium sp.]|nr:FtsX-like permease family protein [Microbacterium sp.]
MTRNSRTGGVGLLARHAANGILGSVLVSGLIAVAVFAAGVAPRAVAQLGTQELRHAVSEMSPIVRDLRGVGSTGLPFGFAGAPTERLIAPTDAAIALYRDELPEPLRSLTAEPQWVLSTASRDAVLPDPAAQVRFVARLALDPRWQERVDIVSGTAPGAWAGDEDDRAADPPLEIAVSSRTASELGIGAGSVLQYGSIELLVTGVFAPIDEVDPYWVHFSNLAEPIVETEPGVPPTIRASVFLDPGSLGGLTSSMTSGNLVARIPVEAGPLTAVNAPVVVQQLRNALAADVVMPYGGSLTVSTLVADAIDSAIARTVAVTALLALAVSGLLGVVLAVFALGIGTIVRRRRQALALAYARGASAAQGRGAMALEGVAIAAPATAVGLTAAALAVPGPVGADGFVLPIAVGLTVPVLFALLSGPGALSEGRTDLGVRGRSSARNIAELAVVGLAVVSLLLLARRGIEESSRAVGIDPLLVLAPLLLAAALCIGALRLYPLPLTLIQRRLRTRDGAVALLGAGRAIRSPAFGFAASFTLVLGVSVVIFSSILGSTVGQAIVAGARDRVGADVLVSAPALLPGTVAVVDRLPGVEGTAALSSITGVRVGERGAQTSLTLIAADTAALHAVRPDIPVLDERVDSAIPLLLSRDIEGSISPDARIAGVEVGVAGVVPVTALPGPARSWALIDTRFLAELGRGEFEPDRLLVALTPDADHAAVSAELDRVVSAAQPEAIRGSVSTLSAEQLLDDARASPLTRGLEAALPWASAAALVLTLLGVALATVAAAGPRSRTVAVLRVLGADARQQRGVLLWEFSPPVIVSVLVGTVVGFSLPLVLARIIDLRSFV